MTVDDTKKVDQARDDRIRDTTKEQPKPRPKETDFDKILESSRLATQRAPQKQVESKTVTEEAIRESAKREDRSGDERKKDDEGKDGRDSKQRGERAEGKGLDTRVIAKGKLKQDSGQSGKQGGYDGTAAKRSLSKLLTRTQAKNLPLDLRGEFAAKLAKAMKPDEARNAQLTQQVINKLIQYVRIGINRKSEKEMQIDLSERIFKGLKLRVTSREGKVGVHFRTADAAGRAVFEKNAQAIRDALSKKGIDVDEITVS